MSEPILVQPTGPIGHMPPWTVDTLIADLRAEGLDARLAYEEHPGGGAVWDIAVVWVSSSTGAAIISLLVNYAVKWLKDMFTNHPDVPRPRAVEIRVYQGDEGTPYMRIEMESAEEEPVVRRFEDLDDFERWTRKKPAEGIKRWKRQ